MNIKPTNSELEILQILWKKGDCTVREVNEELSKDREVEVGYTTTLKLMQIMSCFQQVVCLKKERIHIK